MLQNEETKKNGPNERTEQNSQKRSKQNRHKQSIRCRIQNTGYQDVQGTHRVLQQHKKTHAEMKVTLIEIQKTLQGTNSGGDELQNQVNDLEHKEGKIIQSEKWEEKRIKKMRIG